MSRGIDLDKAQAALKRAAHTGLHGTREERSGRVISSALTQVQYDARTRDLDIRFVTGRRYRYADVPAEVYEKLMQAESKGAFFNTYIRDNYGARELV